MGESELIIDLEALREFAEKQLPPPEVGAPVAGTESQHAAAPADDVVQPAGSEIVTPFTDLLERVLNAPKSEEHITNIDEADEHDIDPPLILTVFSPPEIVEQVPSGYVEISEDLIGYFNPKAKKFDTATRDWLLPLDAAEKARADREAHEAALANKECLLDDAEREVRAEFKELASNIAQQYLTHERQIDLLEDPYFNHVIGPILTHAYQTRAIKVLERYLGADRQMAEELMKDDELLQAVKVAREQYYARMKMSGQATDVFGEKSAFDLRTDPIVAPVYTSRLIEQMLNRSYDGDFEKGDEHAEQPKSSIRQKAQQAFVSLWLNPPGIRSSNEYIPLEARIFSINEQLKRELETINRQENAAISASLKTLLGFKEYINSAAVGDKTDDDKLYVFGGEYGRLESTRDTLERFGGVINETIEPRGLDVNGQPLKYVIEGPVGGTYRDGEADLKTKLLERAGPFKSYIPNKIMQVENEDRPGEVAKQLSPKRKVSIVCLIDSLPDGTAIEPMIVELLDEGTNGDYGDEPMQAYRVIIERVTQKVMNEIRANWHVIGMSNGLIPVKNELPILELTGADRRTQFVNDWLPRQLEVNRTHHLQELAPPEVLAIEQSN